MQEYSNFIFLQSWKILLDGFDKEQAKEILWQIVNYGTTKEIDTDNKMISAIIYGTIAPNMDAMQDRYLQSILNGKKGGRPKKEIDMQEVKELLEKGVSKKAIAKHFEISTETLNRRLKEEAQKPQNSFADNLPQNLQNPQNLNIDNNIDTNTNSDIDNNELESMNCSHSARSARDETRNTKVPYSESVAWLQEAGGFSGEATKTTSAYDPNFISDLGF